MNTFLIVVLAAEGVAILFAAFLAVRNQCVYNVRIAAIDVNDRLRTYEALPSYDAMLYHPKYWLLWTRAHWFAWLARREAA